MIKTESDGLDWAIDVCGAGGQGDCAAEWGRAGACATRAEPADAPTMEPVVATTRPISTTWRRGSSRTTLRGHLLGLPVVVHGRVSQQVHADRRAVGDTNAIPDGNVILQGPGHRFWSGGSGPRPPRRRRHDDDVPTAPPDRGVDRSEVWRRRVDRPYLGNGFSGATAVDSARPCRHHRVVIPSLHRRHSAPGTATSTVDVKVVGARWNLAEVHVGNSPWTERSSGHADDGSQGRDVVTIRVLGSRCDRGLLWRRSCDSGLDRTGRQVHDCRLCPRTVRQTVDVSVSVGGIMTTTTSTDWVTYNSTFRVLVYLRSTPKGEA